MRSAAFHQWIPAWLMTSAVKPRFPSPERHSVHVVLGQLLKEGFLMPIEASMAIQKLVLLGPPLLELAVLKS